MNAHKPSAYRLLPPRAYLCALHRTGNVALLLCAYPQCKLQLRRVFGRGSSSVDSHAGRFHVGLTCPKSRQNPITSFRFLSTLALVGVSSQRLHYLEGPPVQTPVQKYGAGLQATDFELKWATENLTEKRLAQMSRVLRDTRLRLIRVTEANAPRYDRRVKFHFAKRDTGSVGAIAPGAPLASVSIAFDRSIVDTMDALISARLQYNHRLQGCNAGRWSSGVRYTPSAVVIEAAYAQRSSIQQIVAPTVVRPVFGDVYIVPAVMCCNWNGAGVHGQRGEQIGIHTGREAGDTYVLKVGEAAHAELHSLALALSKEPRCPGSGCHASLVEVTEQ